MTIALALSVLVMLAGFCFYYWAQNVRISECGRIAFAFGLLASLFQLSGGLALTLFRR